MSIFITLLALCVALLYAFLKYKQNYWRRRGIPHDPPHFLVGNMKGWRSEKHLIDVMAPVYKKHKGTGPFAGFYLFVNPAVLALDLEFVKNVLIKDFSNFEERGVFTNEKDDILSDNLFSTHAEHWRALRQKLSPTFTSGKMKYMYPTVLKVAEEFNTVVTERVGDGCVMDTLDYLSRFTADVIGTCAFGLECNSLRNPDAEFVRIGKRVIVERHHGIILDSFIEAFPDLAARLRMRQTVPELENFYKNVVRDTIDFRSRNDIKRNDFINIMINMMNDGENGGITFNEIVAQSFIFFVAGFETSSTTMGYALYELARNPEIQERLRAEMNEVLKKHNNELTYECLQEMRYLDQVISETLRMYPVLPQLIRKAKRHYTTSDPKYYIEKGTMVLIPAYAIQHDPEIYPEPEKFDPNRFTDEEVKKRPACAWLPFGDGPRNCIGMRFGKMQTAIGLHYMIKNFKFSVCDETLIPMKFIKESVLLTSKNGIKLKVEPLSK